jgi:predicted RNA binding protein YcfA (HicA-like mRNA interferase family)
VARHDCEFGVNTKKTMRGLKRDGYLVTKTKGGHLSIRHPTRPGTVYSSSTPGDIRSMKNVQAKLKRAFGRSKK